MIGIERMIASNSMLFPQQQPCPYRPGYAWLYNSCAACHFGEMPDAHSPRPVDTLEGVGPAIAARLCRWGIIDTHDLLRYRPDMIHQWVKDVASLAMVRQWQSMALFLEVGCIDRQWAEALVIGCIDSMERLSGAGLKELLAVFAEAQTAHRIAQVPDAETIFDMVRDAPRFTVAVNSPAG